MATPRDLTIQISIDASQAMAALESFARFARRWNIPFATPTQALENRRRIEAWEWEQEKARRVAAYQRLRR